jgi:hypothetical protein
LQDVSDEVESVPRLFWISMKEVDLCERLRRLLAAGEKEFSANYPLGGLWAVENLRIVEFVCKLCDKAFRLFCILEYERRIEVRREQTRNA